MSKQNTFNIDLTEHEVRMAVVATLQVVRMLERNHSGLATETITIGNYRKLMHKLDGLLSPESLSKPVFKPGKPNRKGAPGHAQSLETREKISRGLHRFHGSENKPCDHLPEDVCGLEHDAQN
jgi:hypothetical protein